MKYINDSKLRIDMISDCRLRVIVDLKRFPKLVGPQYFKALCNGVINDPLLKTNEKAYLISDLSEIKDAQNIIEKFEIRRRCVYCNTDVIATNYCEYCIRNYLEKREWTTGDKVFDELIRESQRNTVSPSHIAEWIPFKNFINIVPIAHSCIYILKTLENSDKCHSEIKASFTSEQFYSQTHVKCYGLTREPKTQKFMLVLQKMDSDLQIIKGKRPRIINGTPPEYVDLMIKCWDKDPDKRPEAGIIMKKMEDMLRDIYAPNTEIINKKLEDLLNDAYTNNRELIVHSNRIPVNELSLPLEYERIINDTSSITTENAYSPSSVFEQYRKTTASSMRSPSLLEQDGCNITEECSLLSKQSENITIDDVLNLRQ
ncbi:9401_t:CDS:2, partial [Gigaspora rosea]